MIQTDYSAFVANSPHCVVLDPGKDNSRLKVMLNKESKVRVVERSAEGWRIVEEVD